MKNLKDVDFGLVAQSELKAVETSKKVSEFQIMDFRKQCLDFFYHLVSKINDKSPLGYSLVCSLSCLNPVLISVDGEKTLEKFRRVLNALSRLKRLEFDNCDNTFSEFKKFVFNMKHSAKLEFSKSTDGVDKNVL